MSESKMELKHVEAILVEIIRKKKGHLRFPMYLNQRLLTTDVTELELSVRSYNCLKRAGIGTVGDLVHAVESQEELRKIRNLGKKSADEIMLKLLWFQVSLLKPERYHQYINRVIELNRNVA